MVLEPSPAQRARSIIAASTSLAITVAGRRAHLVGRHHVEPSGRLVLRTPRSGPFGHLLRSARVPAVIDITDLAPVAVRHRVRARLTIAGEIVPQTTGRHRSADPTGNTRPDVESWFAPRVAGLTEADGTVIDIDAAELAAAEPDPLAAAEASLLCHLVDGHRSAVANLAGLVPAGLSGRAAGRRATPVRLDRFGIVLRFEPPTAATDDWSATPDEDVRIPFAAPLADASEAAHRVRQLLAAATRRPAQDRHPRPAEPGRSPAA